MKKISFYQQNKKDDNIKIIKNVLDKNQSILQKESEINNKNKKQKNDLLSSKFVDYGKFIKDKNILYDAAFVIASKDRYDKVYRLINQISTQKTKYKFKIFIFNDGSVNKKYDNLKNEFDIVYLKNEVSAGKKKYYTVINKLWDEAKKHNPQTLIQLDDDFILCENFLDRILDLYYDQKKTSNNHMVFCFHKYYFNNIKSKVEWWDDKDSVLVDGGMCIDKQFLEKFNYELDDIERRITNYSPSFVWVRIAERLKQYGMRVFKTDKSLVWHDGNEDSKLNGEVRKHKKMITRDFIDD